MFKTTALDSVANEYVDEVGITPGTRLEADDRNIIQDELVNAVEAAGQTLDATGVKRSQEAIAMFLNGVGAQSMVDTGTANAKVLTPVTGASGYVFGENYTQLSGAVFLFKNDVLNTGATTVDAGQTAGTLLGVKSLTQPGGAALTGGELVAGQYVSVIYDLGNDRYELSTLDTTAFAASGANSDITSLAGLSTPLSLAQGGSGGAGDSIVKGWINWDGTGTPAISDSFNVTSIGDDAAGQYTITWDTDFANTTYACAGAGSVNAGNSFVNFSTYAVGSVLAITGDSTDRTIFTAIAIGDQ